MLALGQHQQGLADAGDEFLRLFRKTGSSTGSISSGGTAGAGGVRALPAVPQGLDAGVEQTACARLCGDIAAPFCAEASKAEADSAKAVAPLLPA
jgi:hypothetical protein